MRAIKTALKVSGILLAMALFGAMLLPGTADAQGVTIMSIEGATTDENDTFVDVRVRLSQPVDTATSVKFATSSDTAKSGRDFWGTFRTVTIPAGQTVAVESIWMINDRVAENDEQFNVRIWDVRSGSNVVTGATSAKVTVRDDDSVAGPDPIVNVSGTTINEGGEFVDVRIRLGGELQQRASVKFATSAGSAKPGQDYYGTFQTIYFEPGETVKIGRVQLIDDRIAEPNESFKVRIWDGRNITVRTAEAFVQINDND